MRAAEQRAPSHKLWPEREWRKRRQSNYACDIAKSPAVCGGRGRLLPALLQCDRAVVMLIALLSKKAIPERLTSATRSHHSWETFPLNFKVSRRGLRRAESLEGSARMRHDRFCLIYSIEIIDFSLSKDSFKRSAHKHLHFNLITHRVVLSPVYLGPGYSIASTVAPLGLFK